MPDTPRKAPSSATPRQPGDAKVAEPASRNIAAIASLEREALHERSRLDRMTDAVTAVAGSAAFLVGHAVWFGVWISLSLMRERSFDPFPFPFLTLLVSLEAIILTGMVLMTQNRMTRQADKRAHLDLQVNLLAEQELTTMLKMLTALCERMGVAVPARDERIAQLLEDTDIHELASALDHELAEKKASAPASTPARHTPSPHRS